jgi:hypothetical protein
MYCTKLRYFKRNLVSVDALSALNFDFCPVGAMEQNPLRAKISLMEPKGMTVPKD